MNGWGKLVIGLGLSRGGGVRMSFSERVRGGIREVRSLELGKDEC